MRSSVKIIFFFLILLLSGMQVGAAERLNVIVGIPPYAYLAERIGGDRLQVHVLIEQNQDPHTFEPGAKQIMSLGHARVFFMAGLEFEHRLIDKIRYGFKNLEMVDLSRDIVPPQRRHLLDEPPEAGHAEPTDPDQENHDQDAHDHEHQHHGEGDPHIWLSPELLQAQAQKMAAVLMRLDPENAQIYQKNLTGLLHDLRQVKERIATQLRPFAGRSFFVFHPAFAHFGADFGLVQRAVEASGRTPTARQIAALVARAKKENVKIIFVQPQFDHASAEVLAGSIGGVVVPMDPLARNVLDNFRDIAAKLERAFQ